jgi:hypothetical protein
VVGVYARSVRSRQHPFPGGSVAARRIVIRTKSDLAQVEEAVRSYAGIAPAMVSF